MEAVNLSYALRAGSRLQDLSVWHAVVDGYTRTACGLKVPDDQARSRWNEDLEPRCAQCVRRIPR
jgi:hypothetical protein